MLLEVVHDIWEGVVYKSVLSLGFLIWNTGLLLKFLIKPTDSSLAVKIPAQFPIQQNFYTAFTELS